MFRSMPPQLQQIPFGAYCNGVPIGLPRSHRPMLKIGMPTVRRTISRASQLQVVSQHSPIMRQPSAVCTAIITTATSVHNVTNGDC